MSSSDSPAAPVSKSQGKRRFPIRRVVAVLVVIGGIIWGIHEMRLFLATERTDDAFITGRLHRITPNISGNIVELLVQDNQRVKEGDVLAKIDPQEFEIAEWQNLAALDVAKTKLSVAEAKLVQVRATDLQSDAGISVANAEIQQRESALALARTILRRNESLGSSGISRAVSEADLDRAHNEVAGAEAALSASNAKLASARAGKEASISAIALAVAEVSSAKADIQTREATLAEARRQLHFTKIVAPVSGRIGNRNVELGNRVQIGQSLFALVEDECWIVANFKETQLEHMKVGQTVDITVDALGDRHFTGKIDSMSPSTGAQFALLPPDNATGNFTKVVQRVPVKIVFDPKSIQDVGERLHPGLSTIVRVHL